MPLCPTCRPPGHISNDSMNRSIYLPARHHKRHTGHKNQLYSMQQDDPISGGTATHTPPPTLREYPFQCICADYFHYKGHTYLVIVDRYSNWPIMVRAEGGATGPIKTLRLTFATYGIPDELSSDGEPGFVSHTTREFMGCTPSPKLCCICTQELPSKSVWA